MYRSEEDDSFDVLGHFLLLGAVAFLCIALVVFAAWAGWLS